MVEDAELLRRYAEKQDAAAFRALVDRHIQFVFVTARRSLNGDSHAAEDVAQVVFAAAAKQARTLAERSVVLPAWLYRTTRNAAADFVRREVQRRRREKEASDMHDTAPRVPVETLRPMLDEAIDQLSEADRTAIILRFFGQRPLVQVGAALRVSEDAARMRVDRALEKLQSAFARRGITSTAAALGAALADEALAAAPEGIAARVTSGAIAAGKTAGSAAAVTAGFMSVMKTVVGAAVLLGILGTASVEVVRWRTAMHDASAAEDAASEAAARARAAEADAVAAEQALARSQQQVSALAAANAARSTSAPTGAGTVNPLSKAAAWDPRAEGTAFMNRHPEVRDALRDYVRARARFSYGPLLDSLALTAEQRARLEQYLMLGSGMGARVPGDPSDQRQLTLSLWSAENAQAEPWVKQMLGPDGSQRLNEYRSTVNARDDAARIAGALWDSDAPLTGAQASQLATLFAEHQIVVNRRQQYDWPAIASAAANFLSAGQLGAIADLQAQAQFNAILSRPASSTSTATAAHP